MADLPDRRELFAVGRRSIVTTPNLRINPKVVDIEGSDVNIVLGAMTMMGEELSAAFAVCMRGLFVETAERDALDRVAFDRYQLTRFPATPATVDLTMSRPFAVSAPIGIYPAGSRVQTPDGTQFALDVDAIFPAIISIDGQSVVVPATALVAGPTGNVPAGAITQFVEQPFDGTLTVTNAATAAGGIDQETDTEFRSRILQFFPTVRRGTLEAIEFGALQVPGVAVAKAYEIDNIVAGVPLPACLIQVIIADRNGGSSSKMVQNVNTIELTYRAAGIPLQVLGGQVRFPFEAPLPSLEWDIDFLTGVNQKQVQEEIRAVTVAVSQFLRPGETLYRSALIAGARTVPGAVIHNESLKNPAGDILTNNNQELIRIRPEHIIFTS